MITAVYPGTFDPITCGHIDIIERSASLFDKLIIGIYANPEKRPLFSLEQRLQLVEKSIASFPNIEVKVFKGLTVDFIHHIGAKVMIRGLRASSDFEREFEMALMNKKLSADIEMLCMMTSSQYQFLSSSLIKEVAMLEGNLEGMVPDHVAIALEEVRTMSSEIATGKDKM